MNNVTLGNERFTYYETIGGGQGACPDADGPSGVHVAMSNTLATPVEALELAYPLRVERWGLRLASGGAGAHRGGDGVVRALRVLEDCRVSILRRAPHATRRREPTAATPEPSDAMPSTARSFRGSSRASCARATCSRSRRPAVEAGGAEDARVESSR